MLGIADQDTVDSLDKIIISCVSEAAGQTETVVLGMIYSRLVIPNSITFPPGFGPIQVGDAVKARLQALADSAQIIRVDADCPGRSIHECTYYPLGFSIRTTPKGALWTNDEEPSMLREPLSPLSRPIADALIVLLNQCDERTRLHIVSKFCPRCGSLTEDYHICNE